MSTFPLLTHMSYLQVVCRRWGSKKDRGLLPAPNTTFEPTISIPEAPLAPQTTCTRWSFPEDCFLLSPRQDNVFANILSRVLSGFGKHSNRPLRGFAGFLVTRALTAGALCFVPGSERRMVPWARCLQPGSQYLWRLGASVSESDGIGRQSRLFRHGCR